MRLLIISHMPHYTQNGQVVGWGPTAQEIDHLSQLFDEVRHIACLHSTPAPASSLPYTSKRVTLIGVPPAGGNYLSDKLNVLRIFPLYFQKIRQELPWADVVHVRCPANISMLAIIALSLVKHPPYRWVKYAGNWQPEIGTPFSYNFQRWWLSKGLHRGTVSVNGQWPQQPSHIYSFLNPSLPMSEIERGREIGLKKEITNPLQILFVGALNTSKGVERALRIVKSLRQREIPVEFHLAGDGPQRAAFESWVQDNGLEQHSHFHGWLPKPALAEFYGRAHILLHPTDSDGWPKVISEAMAYGVVPVAGAVSSIPQILAESGSGLAFPPTDVDAFTEAICQLYLSPQTWKAASRAGLETAMQFTYDSYLERVREMFQSAWGISLEVSK